MKKQSNGKKTSLVINIVMIAVIVLLDVLSTVLFGHENENRYLLRIISRGVMGVLLVYDSIYLLMADRWTLFSIKASSKQRLIGAILIGIVGIGCVITAFLGYGINGDPRYNLWK